MPSLCSCKTSASMSLSCGKDQPQEQLLLVSGGKKLQYVTSIHLIYTVLEKKNKNKQTQNQLVNQQNSFKYRKFLVPNS